MGKSLADLVWVWGCGASWQVEGCLALDKSFAHRSLVSLEMPPAFIFRVLWLFILFFLLYLLTPLLLLPVKSSWISNRCEIQGAGKVEGCSLP